MAAVSTAATTLDPNLGRAADFVRPDFHQVNLDIEGYLKAERDYKLDFDDQICRLNLLPTGCPLPASQCPYRHTTPASGNFKGMPPLPTNPKDREKKTTVCRHYLRNLCKMGDHCEYTHDFNLRTMPVCSWFMKTGKCEVGGECLYHHPRDRRVECPDYNRGFCPLGPECPRRHVRRLMCGAYMAGFCPDGDKCKRAHPSPLRPEPEEYINPIPPDPEASTGPPPQLPPGYGRWREYTPDIAVTFNPSWQQGGSLGMWRQGGLMSANISKTDPGGNGGGDASGSRRGGWVKDLSTVLCFKCNQHGHFANACPNQAVPGDRGGLKQRGE